MRLVVGVDQTTEQLAAYLATRKRVYKPTTFEKRKNCCCSIQYSRSFFCSSATFNSFCETKTNRRNIDESPHSAVAAARSKRPRWPCTNLLFFPTLLLFLQKLWIKADTDVTPTMSYFHCCHSRVLRDVANNDLIMNSTSNRSYVSYGGVRAGIVFLS